VVRSLLGAAQRVSKNGGKTGRGGDGRFKPAPSEARADGWRSALTGIGDLQRDKRLSTDHAAEIVTTARAADLWRGNPLAARVIETWPNEMTREGWDVVVDRDARDANEGLAGDVEAKLEELGVVDALWRGLAYERAYGGAAILLGAQDMSGSLENPLGDRVTSLDWLTVFEPEEITPRWFYADPRAPKFGEPSHYEINPLLSGPPKDRAATPPERIIVHESRLLIFPGILVSRRIPFYTPTLWGDSVMTRVWDVLRDHGMGFNAAAVLMQDFSQAVFKIQNLAGAMAEDRDDEIKIRAQAVELSRSVARAIIIDAEEEFERKQTPVTGLPELLDRFSILLAAAADMPLTLLMGVSPGGLNATGESDIRFFYDRVRAQQERKLKPHLERLVKIIFGVLGVEEPEQWSVKFRPLWQHSVKEMAEARKLQSETDKTYVEMMAVSPADIARSRFGGDGYSFDTDVDMEERDRLEEEAKEAEKLAMEQSIMSAEAARGKVEAETAAKKKPAPPAGA
jgi:phage-related protein (TIGR01555 family)